MEIRETSDYMCDENFEKERRIMKCNEEMKKKMLNQKNVSWLEKW